MIAGLSLMLAVLCQILKETGARVGEILRLEWTDIDFQRRLIYINYPEKDSNPRIIPVSEQCISMINLLPRERETPFTQTSKQSNFEKQRKRIACQINNPRILKIHFHTFRHWHGTMLYHKTKDIVFVQQRLGHKDIENTMVYITLEQTLFQQTSDEFTVKVADTKEEAVELFEVGFEYVGNILGGEMFRKRK